MLAVSDFSIHCDVPVSDITGIIRDKQGTRNGVYIVQGDLACVADVETFGGKSFRASTVQDIIFLVRDSLESVGFAGPFLAIDNQIATVTFNKGSGIPLIMEE